MKILLIGNLGQVGREIEILARNLRIPLEGFDRDTIDITDQNQVLNFIAQKKDFSLIINAAAYTAVDRAEDEIKVAEAINFLGVKNLARAAKENNLPLLHISTDYVFSGEKKGAYREDDLPNPLNAYGKTKLLGDQILIDTWEKHFILRVSWVFGQYGNNFVKTILRLAKQKEELNIVSDQHGCPTEASDIARVLLLVAQKIAKQQGKWGIYNYCGLPPTAWFDFAKTIIELGEKYFLLVTKKINPIKTSEYVTKAKRPLNSELAVEKIITDYQIIRHDWRDDLKLILPKIEV
jgi:dTDP-4-dehydrorhamnose reductase